MSEEEIIENKASGGNFFSVLGLLFIGLKFAEVGIVASWPWWLVLSPLYAPLLILMIIARIILIIIPLIIIPNSKNINLRFFGANVKLGTKE